MKKILIAAAILTFVISIAPGIVFAGVNPTYTQDPEINNCLPNQFFEIKECYSGANCPSTTQPQYDCGFGVFSGSLKCTEPQCQIQPRVLAGDVCEVGGRETGSGAYDYVTNGISVRHGSCTTLISRDTVGAVIGSYGTQGKLYEQKNFIYGETSNAVFDALEGKLVTCNGKTEYRVYADASNVYCSSGVFGPVCNPYVGDNQCESACGAGDGPGDNFIDEKDPRDALIKSIECAPGKDKDGSGVPLVKKGEQFTIKYKVSSSDIGSCITIKRSNFGVEKSVGRSGQEACSYYTGEETLNAPITTDTYTYNVETLGTVPQSCPFAVGYNDIRSCTVKVVECVVDLDCGTTPNPNTGLLPYCDSPQFIINSDGSKTLINPNGRTPAASADVASYTCQRPQRCTINDDCVGLGQTNRCCIATGPDPNNKQCHDKGLYTPNPRFLCDPGVWLKCDSGKINSVQSFDGKSFKCVVENDDYKWVDVSADTTKQTSSNEDVNVFTIVLGFLRNLFRLS